MTTEQCALWLLQAAANFVCLAILLRFRAWRPLIVCQAWSAGSELVLDSLFLLNYYGGMHHVRLYENLWIILSIGATALEVYVARSIRFYAPSRKQDCVLLCGFIFLHQALKGITQITDLPFHLSDSSLAPLIAFLNACVMAGLCVFAYAVSDASASGENHARTR